MTPVMCAWTNIQGHVLLDEKNALKMIQMHIYKWQLCGVRERNGIFDLQMSNLIRHI